jgi:aldehyde:ferredoxin oxidoreductase
MRVYIGGAGLGAKLLWEEVRPDQGWDHGENRLILATGPLAGLPVWGTGGLSVVTRGAMTNGATSTQANGFFGASLKYSGYDAIVIEGQSAKWVYLFIQDSVAELRDAAHLVGKDTWETQEMLEAEHGLAGHQMSVYSIGPAGENLVRFAAIQGDYGHVASKNGCGAVMGRKRLKAVAIVRGTCGLTVADPRGVFLVAEEIAHELKTNPSTRPMYEYGTLGLVLGLLGQGMLPIKNFTTNVAPPGVDLAAWEAPNLRGSFDHRGHQCNACGMHHCQMQVLPKGRHKGEIVEEPEYEGWAGLGWAIGCTDPTAVSWLNNRVDRACVDLNEFGWLVGWVMECQEKGYLSPSQLDGLEVRWGDVEAAAELLQIITYRKGFGDVLAEGVRHAAAVVGGLAADCAIYTVKGSVPRSIDHRAFWFEMLDTCTSSTGTLETAPPVYPTEFGLPARINPFDPDAVPRTLGGFLGRRHFEDSLGVCTFTTRTLLENLCRVLSATTGWDYRKEEAMRMGRRTAALLRAFNVRCGITPDRERPSRRYSMTPTDGPARGQDVLPHWDQMVDTWYATVGYDRKTGRPTPETLRSLGLGHLIPALYPDVPGDH